MVHDSIVLVYHTIIRCKNTKFRWNIHIFHVLFTKFTVFSSFSLYFA